MMIYTWELWVHIIFKTLVYYENGRRIYTKGNHINERISQMSRTQRKTISYIEMLFSTDYKIIWHESTSRKNVYSLRWVIWWPASPHSPEDSHKSNILTYLIHPVFYRIFNSEVLVFLKKSSLKIVKCYGSWAKSPSNFPKCGFSFYKIVWLYTLEPSNNTRMLDQTLTEVYFQEGASYIRKSDQVIKRSKPPRRGLQVHATMVSPYMPEDT
jgi:hypothetical protein